MSESSTPHGTGMSEEYHAEWSARIAAPLADTDVGSHAVLVVRVHNEWLALPMSILEEVVSGYRSHSLPHRGTRVVLGLANVRGQLVPLLSLAELLHIEPTATTGTVRLLVLRSAAGFLSVPVDEILGVYRYHVRDVLDVPATLPPGGQRFSHGLLELAGHSVALTDDAALLAALNGSLS